MKKLLMVFFVIALVLPAAYSLTASIGNAKAIIRVNASPENPAIIERTVLVMNKNDIPVKVELEPSEEFKKFVTIIDKEFELQPGEQKNAEFILAIDRGGTIEGRILVGFSPVDPESKENSVGLSSTLIIVSDGPIIDEPEENQTAQEEVETVVEENDDAEEAIEIVEELDDETAMDQVTGDVAIEEQQSREASPVVGILIIAIIIGIGSISMFFIMRLFKKK